MSLSPFISAVLCLEVFAGSASFAVQSSTQIQPNTAVAASSSKSAAAVQDTLVDGTPVKLRLSETISSSNAKTGQEVPFEVFEDVEVQGVTVIAKGATALAVVTDAARKRSLGRGGKLDLSVQSVRLVNNEKVKLRATAGGKAGGHTAVMTTAMVASGILFFPAAPLFLFIHGKDLTLPKGLETTAFVDGDTKLNPILLTAAALSQVLVEADISACDVDVDGALVGSTPSQLNLAAGKHTIRVHKSGYADWNRDLTVSGSAIRLHAEMQKQSTPK